MGVQNLSAGKADSAVREPLFLSRLTGQGGGRASDDTDARSGAGNKAAGGTGSAAAGADSSPDASKKGRGQGGAKNVKRQDSSKGSGGTSGASKRGGNAAGDGGNRSGSGGKGSAGKGGGTAGVLAAESAQAGSSGRSLEALEPQTFSRCQALSSPVVHVPSTARDLRRLQQQSARHN